MAIEDFTTYTEVDEGADISVAAAKINYTELPRNVTSYVYKDKGAGYFSGDFEHKFSFKITAVNTGTAVPTTSVWLLSNDLNDTCHLGSTSKSFVHFYVRWNSGGDDYFLLRVMEDGVNVGSDPYYGWSLNVEYFIRITRDDDGGATNKGRYTAYIATTNYDDDGGDLVDTLIADSSAQQNDFRYIHGLNSYDDGVTNWMTGYVQNLDLLPTIDLIADIDIGLSCSGDLSCQKTVIGSTPITISSSAVSSIEREIDGQINVAISATGVLNRITKLQGQADIDLGANASLSIERNLIGESIVAISTNGTMKASVPLVGMSVIGLVISGSLLVAKNIVGVVSIATESVGNLEIERKLTGQIDISVTNVGDLVAGQIQPLVGMSVIGIDCLGDLIRQRGVLTITQIQIETLGEISRDRSLTGASPVDIIVSGVMNSTRLLTGSIDILTSVIGRMVVYQVLHGSIMIEIETNGALILLARPKPGWLVGVNTGSLNSVVMRL